MAIHSWELRTFGREEIDLPLLEPFARFGPRPRMLKHRAGTFILLCLSQNRRPLSLFFYYDMRRKALDDFRRSRTNRSSLDGALYDRPLAPQLLSPPSHTQHTTAVVRD